MYFYADSQTRNQSVSQINIILKTKSDQFRLPVKKLVQNQFEIF